MKIYMDLTVLLQTEYLTGIQRVVIEFTLRLLKNPKFDLCLFSACEQQNSFCVISSKEFEQYYTGHAGIKKACLTKQPFYIAEMHEGDVYFELDGTWGLPRGRIEFFQQLKKQGVKIVGYIYDIITITAPQFMPAGGETNFVPYVVAHCFYDDLILCSTGHVKFEIFQLMKRYGIPPCRLGILPFGSDFQTEHQKAGQLVQQEARKIADSGKKYILTVGTIEPRKNHKVLFDAYNSGLETLGVQLVLVGRRGWMTDALLERLHANPQWNKNLFHLEGLNDASVAYLYKHAFLSAFPSYTEGFGLPIIESLGYGIPTISADVPVSREIGGRYCDYFNPDEPLKFVDIVRKYITNPTLYQKRKNELSQFHPHTWDEMCEKLSAYLEETGASAPKNVGADIDFSSIIMRIKRDINVDRVSLPAPGFSEGCCGQSTTIEEALTERLKSAVFESAEEKIIYQRLLNTWLAGRTQSQVYPEEKILVQENAEGIQLSTLDHLLWIMDTNRENYAFRHIYSCRKVIGGLIVFCKRAVRKLLKWYLEPVCFQQTEFNGAATGAVQQLTSNLREIGAKQKVTQDRIISLQGTLQSTCVELEKQRQEELSTFEERQKAERLEWQEELTALEQRRQEELTALEQRRQEELTALERRQQEEHIEIGHRHQKEYTELEQRQCEKNAELKEQIAALQTQLAYCTNQSAELAHRMELLDELKLGIFQDRPDLRYERNKSAQSGEDAIICTVTGVLGIQLHDVTYLDLGANHARYLSNTNFFYQNGARGVLVEANPKLIPELKFYRHGDVILNRCISSQSGKSVLFYLMNGDGISSSNIQSVEDCMRLNPELKIEQTVEVQTITINEILEQYFENPPVYVNIDIEGAEMDILQSMDFSRFRPLAFSIEMIPYLPNTVVIDEKNEEILAFMKKLDYVEYAFTGINSIFLDRKRLTGGSR